MGGSSGGVHCEIVATCDKSGESVAFGIGGGGEGVWDRLVGGKTPPKYENPAPPLPAPGMGVSEYSTSCGAESDCDCETLNCFQRLHGGATPPPYYALWQNSNTYAHWLLTSCGCSFNPFQIPGVKVPINRPPGAFGW